MILNFSGCREYKTTTKINSDGSCIRTVMVKDNSVEPDSIVFPIPADKSWKIERTKAKDDSTQTVYTATKDFDDVNDINNEYKNKEKIGLHVNLDKKFRWFYTYYDYEEVYHSYFPFSKIPLKNFLTPHEYELYFKNDTTKVLKKRLDKYAEENYFEYFFDELITLLGKNKIADLTPEYVASKKSIIKEHIDEYGDKTEELMKYMEKVLGTKSVWKLRDGIDNIVKSILEKMDYFSSANGSYKSEVTMPGIILTTNAKTVEGNKAIWEFDAGSFCYEDLTMTVQSRAVNVWAFAVSGVIVVVVIILLVLPRLRRKKIM
jgi:adenylate kinase family enzyme